MIRNADTLVAIVIIGVAAIALFVEAIAWVLKRIDTKTSARIDREVAAALDDQEADEAWADMLAIFDITPAEMRDRFNNQEPA